MDPILKATAFADEIVEAIGKNHICTAVYGPPLVGNYIEGKTKIPIFIALNHYDPDNIQAMSDEVAKMKHEGIGGPHVVELVDLEGMSDSVPDELMEVTMNYKILRGNDILRILPEMDYEHARAQAELAVRRYMLILRSQLLHSLGDPEELEGFLTSLAFYCQLSMQLYYRVMGQKFETPTELQEQFYEDFPDAREDFEMLVNYSYGDASDLTKEPIELIASSLDTVLQPLLRQIDELGD